MKHTDIETDHHIICMGCKQFKMLTNFDITAFKLLIGLDVGSLWYSFPLCSLFGFSHPPSLYPTSFLFNPPAFLTPLPLPHHPFVS